jgi:hypothetical protein
MRSNNYTGQILIKIQFPGQISVSVASFIEVLHIVLEMKHFDGQTCKHHLPIMLCLIHTVQTIIEILRSIHDAAVILRSHHYLKYI